LSDAATAANPPLAIGHGILGTVLERLGSFAVATMPEPWSLVDPAVRVLARPVIFVESMDHDVLRVTETALPAVEAVVGLGGGAAIDSA
jgi:hypothetical protein